MTHHDGTDHDHTDHDDQTGVTREHHEHTEKHADGAVETENADFVHPVDHGAGSESESVKVETSGEFTDSDLGDK